MGFMKRLERKRQFSAVAKVVGFALKSKKCFIFQWGLTDTLSATIGK
jgi:hypothetical protein